MKNYQKIAIIISAGLLISSCAGQSSVFNQPIGISKSTNGLQGSVCNCGGVTSKINIKKKEKALKAKDKARVKVEKDLK